MGEHLALAKREPDIRCYMMYAFLFSDDSRHFFVINKFYFCLGVGAEGLGGECPEAKTPYCISNS
jgi:hypothetical protein